MGTRIAAAWRRCRDEWKQASFAKRAVGIMAVIACLVSLTSLGLSIASFVDIQHQQGDDHTRQVGEDARLKRLEDAENQRREKEDLVAKASDATRVYFVTVKSKSEKAPVSDTAVKLAVENRSRNPISDVKVTMVRSIVKTETKTVDRGGRKVKIKQGYEVIYSAGGKTASIDACRGIFFTADSVPDAESQSVRGWVTYRDSRGELVQQSLDDGEFSPAIDGNPFGIPPGLDVSEIEVPVRGGDC